MRLHGRRGGYSGGGGRKENKTPKVEFAPEGGRVPHPHSTHYRDDMLLESNRYIRIRAADPSGPHNLVTLTR